MNVFKWILVVAILGAYSAPNAAESNHVSVSHYEPLQKLVLRSTSNSGSQKAQPGGPVNLSFDALGKSFDLQLEPNANLLSATSRNALAAGVDVYRGQLAGVDDSWVRIVVFNDVPRGLIWDGNEMFAIEAPDDSLLQTDAAVIYRLADTSIAPGRMSCGNASLAGNGAAVYSKLLGELGATVAQAQGAVSELNMGIIGDFEFTTARGGDVLAAAAITTRLNNVDGIFSQQLGVQITVQTLETFSGSADPFTDETDASALLDEVAVYRVGTPAQNMNGLTHLYTGRSLDGTTVGIAYRDALCSSFFGSGLSEGNGSATFDSLVAAHEIGHNFGAPHDGQVGGLCESEPETFIMAPSINGSNQFSPCSKSIMQDRVSAASCIAPLPSIDMSVELNGQVSTLLIGASTDLIYDLSNNGSLPATTVAADFTIPSTLTVNSVVVSSGSCSSGAGTVSCTLGDVPGFSSRTVTISTTPTSVGDGTLSASVTADVDDRLDNNTEALQVTVNPAVDLAVNTPTSVSVNLDQSTTVSGTLDNLSQFDATGVDLSVTVNDDLRINSASWSIGSCTVTAQQIDCQSSNFAAQSSATVSIGVTGIDTGSKGYTLTLSSNEADADPRNNSVTGSVQVNEANGDEGGGTTGPLFLCLLGLITLIFRRRP